MEYNVTGLDAKTTQDDFDLSGDWEYFDASKLESSLLEPQTPSVEIEKKKKKKGNNNMPPSFKIPEPPSATAPPGPAYSNQPFTLLSYTQYFANLTRINEKIASEGSRSPRFDFEVEYSTDDDGVCRMPDLTVRSFLELAIRIGEDGTAATDESISSYSSISNTKVNEAWRTFLSRAFTGFVNVDDLNLGRMQQ